LRSYSATLFWANLIANFQFKKKGMRLFSQDNSIASLLKNLLYIIGNCIVATKHNKNTMQSSQDLVTSSKVLDSLPTNKKVTEGEENKASPIC